MKKILTTLNVLLICIASIWSIYLAITRDTKLVRILVDLSVIITITLPYIFEKLFKIRTTTLIKFIFISFIFSSHFMGSILDLFHSTEYYDKITHFVSGMIVALLTPPILKLLKVYNRDKLWTTIAVMIMLSSAIALGWEIFEYFSNIIFNNDPQKTALTGVNDTMQDMIVAILGTLLVSVWCAWHRKSSDILAQGIEA